MKKEVLGTPFGRLQKTVPCPACLSPPPPPVPDLSRVEGETVNEVIDWLTRYYEEDGCPWSYRRGTKAINTAYRGLHRLDLLLAACEKEKIKQGRISNTEIVRFGAPLAFGRSTQVFDLPPRRFPFGQNRYAAYRVPFLFCREQDR